MESWGNKSVTGPFAALGHLAGRKPWLLLAIWLLLLALAAPLSQKAPARLFGGSGDIANSASLRTDSLLNADFANPYAQLLVVTMQRKTGVLSSKAQEDSLADLIRQVE